MTPEDQEKYPPAQVTLKSGVEVTLRPLAVDDAEKLGDFYEQVPREDFRFYLPHPLDREHARQNAAKALSPVEVVLVLETPAGEIGGYAWYRWHDETDEKSGFGICVRRDLQGAGEGLMSRLFEIAKEIGPPIMMLTVHAANKRALGLYRKMGFEVVGEGTFAARPALGFAAEPQYHMERNAR